MNGIRLVAIAAAAVLTAGCGRLTPPPPPPTATTTTPAATPRGATRFGGPSNLAANGSFEQRIGITPWAGLLDTTAAISHDVSRFGRASLRVTATSSSPYGVVLPSAIGFPGVGDRYRFSVWIYALQPSRVSITLVAPGELTAKPETVASVTGVAGPRWTALAVTGRVLRPRRTSLDVYVKVNTSIAGGDTFYLDGVRLTGGPR